MAYEQRDNSGTLFKNDRKESTKHPDYKGDVMIDGKTYWISAWIKDGQRGKFMSLAFNPKDERQPSQSRESQPQPGPVDDDGSDCPF